MVVRLGRTAVFVSLLSLRIGGRGLLFLVVSRTLCICHCLFRLPFIGGIPVLAGVLRVLDGLVRRRLSSMSLLGTTVIWLCIVSSL